MHLLLIHPESSYFAGAEKMLGYFLAELARHDGARVSVATVQGSKVAALLPPNVTPIWIEASPRLSPTTLWRQAAVIKKHHNQVAFDIVHGWAARDWELASLVGWRCGCSSIGTLHDHPRASFISKRRQRLMRWCARRGLERIICVSSAVQNACKDAGYPPSKLTVIHNGLPGLENLQAKVSSRTVRLGFLSVLSERKGLRELLQIADRLTAVASTDWELHIAGEAQDAAGERLVSELRGEFKSKSWWTRVRWHGWVESPANFLQEMDLLLVTSRDFDPFPTVLLEAGRLGVPVLASRVGGVSEIVVEGQTGWLFDTGGAEQAVRILDDFLSHPELGLQMGQRARARIGREFTAAKMVAEYGKVYSTFLNNV